MCPFKLNTSKFLDERGQFAQISEFPLLNLQWKQVNTAFSKAGVVRGLHYQENVPQGKLIICNSGLIVDVGVSSSGEVYEFELLPGEAVYIPPGYAHGYWSKMDSSITYLCTEPYVKEWDRGWNVFSKKLKLPWSGKDGLIVSEKDRTAPEFKKR